MYDDALPLTGAGAMLVGGHAVGLPTVVAVATAVMVAGLVALRLATRRMRAAARH